MRCSSLRTIRGSKLLLTALFVVFLEIAFAWKSPSSQKKVLLSDIDVLTLYSDRTTDYRRTKPFPQLSCVGGDAQKYGYRVEAMQCRNMGGSYGDREDAQWSCTAEIPDEFKLGRTEVVCEGYSSPDDVYILKGSCAVEYTLHLTSKGKEVYLSKGYKNPFSDLPTFSIPQLSLWQRFSNSFFLFNIFRRIKDLASSIFEVILNNPILILATVYFNYRLIRWTLSTIYKLIRWFFPTTPLQPRRPRQSFWSNFFGGGGGGNDPPGPPPPYSRNPPRKTYQVPPETQPWNPGFWTGLAGGAAAGYGLGRRGEQNQQRPETRTYTEPPQQGGSWWSGNMRYAPAAQPSGWFGGSSGNAGASASASRERDRDREQESSGSTHTSTGFGGTRRR